MKKKNKRLVPSSAAQAFASVTCVLLIYEISRATHWPQEYWLFQSVHHYSDFDRHDTQGEGGKDSGGPTKKIWACIPTTQRHGIQGNSITEVK